jgi:hypothetical protein
MASQKISLFNTGIALPIEQHRLLREAARGRQRAAGGAGRASVSRLISELVSKHRADLLLDAKSEPTGTLLGEQI